MGFYCLPRCQCYLAQRFIQLPNTPPFSGLCG